MRETTSKVRLALLRRSMRKAGLDWLILSHRPNVTYVTGFMGEDSWAIVGPRKCVLLTDSRYSEQASKECHGCEVVERKEGMTKESLKLIGRGRGAAGIEDTMPVGVFGLLRRVLKGRLKRAGALVERQRQIKDAHETGLIKEAAAIAWDALGGSLVLRVGMTESELAGRIEFEMRKLGAAPCFETIVAFGANASQAHYKPGARRLRFNDTILIDFGVRWKGYCCDMTRCFAVGRAGRSYQRAYDAVLEAHNKGVSMVRAGASVREIDEAVRKVIMDKGLPPYGHGLGHGLGLEVHEWPTISTKSDAVLKAGQVITIEPGVYIAGRLGIRIEDDYLVTEKGCRLLSGGSDRFAVGPLVELATR
jgi:Xaa-Pro aminopeptidase